MLKSINKCNTIDEVNIYMMEPSEIQKIFPGIMELIKLLENLYLYNNTFCNFLYLFSNIIDYLSIIINIINCILT